MVVPPPLLTFDAALMNHFGPDPVGFFDLVGIRQTATTVSNPHRFTAH
jgi:hypothetical protein